MKRATNLFLLLFAAATLQQCSNQDMDDAGSVSKVSFEFSVQSSLSGTLIKEVFDQSTVSISLVNPNGKLVVQRELSVLAQGDVLSSETIELVRGEYRIKEFTVHDSNQNVRFFLPVNRPNSCEPDKNLMKTFYAGGNQTKKITLELVPFFSFDAGS